MKFFLILSSILLTLKSCFSVDDTCSSFGYEKSVLNMDLQWVMQGYQIAFQGFFVELLGFSESISKLMPQARLVKSSFRKSFDESPFINEENFLHNELFKQEEIVVNDLTTKVIGQKPVSEFPTFLGSKQVSEISCNMQAFEKDFSYQGATLSKHISLDIHSPVDCCHVCVSNPLCLSWTYESIDETDVCRLMGRMDQSGATVSGAVSGRMISTPTPAPVTNIEVTNSEQQIPTRQPPKRRSPVPRALIFHGTTCIHLNHSVSMATRDINTILIGRYMLERPYLIGGYNLDEYAVMHCAARMDEIWVPTEWHKDVFYRLFQQQGSLSSMPLITIIPEAVDTSLFNPYYTQSTTIKRRSIVTEDRLYIADATRLPIDIDNNRMTVRKNCIFIENQVVCNDYQNFEFLSIFKWEYRKGWDVMLDAYWNAFTRNDHVLLRIRSYVPNTSAGDRNITRMIEIYAKKKYNKELFELAAVVWEKGVEGFTIPKYSSSIDQVEESDSSHVGMDTVKGTNTVELSGTDTVELTGTGTVEYNQEASDETENENDMEVKQPVETHLTREDMRDLLASANAFVLSTRGEGWGLPIAEAMAMALPVIVTNYSGPTAFTNIENAYLVPVLSELDEYSFAKPNVEVLTTLFRQVILESSEEGGYLAQEKGLKAREKMKEISPDSIVCKMNDRLRYHASLRGWNLP